jgi:hypothetical protein
LDIEPACVNVVDGLNQGIMTGGQFLRRFSGLAELAEFRGERQSWISTGAEVWLT